jgi:hypothetical protein
MFGRLFGWLIGRQSRFVALEMVPDVPQPRPQDTELKVKRQKARDRYAVIAGRLKAAAGVREHIEHKKISGRAWMATGRILAPTGITRRQLYVLAHECGHIVLHSTRRRWNKPNHVIEHEAEVFAHRALRRYGLEVPEKSANWARGYVAQCIRKDRANGKAICSMAEAFANGARSAYAPLPGVDAIIQKSLAPTQPPSIAPPVRRCAFLANLGVALLDRILGRCRLRQISRKGARPNNAIQNRSR